MGNWKIVNGVSNSQYYNSVSTPHIPISLYNKTDEEVSSNVYNDEGGEHCCYGNFS